MMIRIAVLLLALTLASAACGGSDPDAATQSSSSQSSSTQSSSSSEGTETVSEIPGELKDQAADKLNVNKDSLEFNDPFLLGPAGCFLQTVYSTETTAFGARFAVLANGDVLEAGTPEAVSTVLESCFFGPGNEITADQWAELVVRIDQTPLLVRVMTDDLSFAVEDLGTTWTPPEMSSDGDTHTLHFFAYGEDFGDAYDVTATRTADGQFSSQYTEILP